MTKYRIAIIAFAVIAGFLLAAVFAAVNKQAHRQAGDLIAVTDDAFAPPLLLTDHNGKKTGAGDFAGKYRLIYFGFTYCPAICPTELAKVTKALNALGDKANMIQPLFVTVDPERDTPEKMKSYVSLFHPSLIGLTGTPAQVKQALKDYKIYAAKVQDPQMSDYTMDHSSFIYFIAPDERLLHIFKMPDTAEQMTDIMGRWIDQESASNAK